MKRFVAPLLASSVIWVAPAIAQTTDEEAELVQERVVISLPGAPRLSGELIGNATVLNRDEILDELATTLGDTLDNRPGVASTNFGPGASRPVLRGLGLQRVLVLTNGIGVIDASAASPDHQVAADGIDAQRIEILRGPAALAYGGQAIGGVVNVIDGFLVEEKPTDAFSGEAFALFTSVSDGVEGAGRFQATFGDFVFTGSGSARSGGNIDIPGFALQDELLTILEAEGDEAAEDPAFGELPNSFFNSSNFGFGVSWVGENAFFGVSARRTSSVYGLPNAGPELFEEEEEEGEEGEGEEGEEEEEEAPFIDLDQTRFDFRGGIVFDGPVLDKLTISGSYADYEHTEFEAVDEPGTFFDNDGFEGRLELDHTLGIFSGAIGVQGRTQAFSAVGEEAFVSPTDTRFIGVFLYEAAEFENGFGVEGGLRYDSTQLTNIVEGEVDFDTFSGSFGVHQHFEALGLFIGGAFAYTERAPTDIELFSGGPHLATDQFEIGDPTLDVEAGINIEGTVRYTQGNFTIGANGFFTDFDDFIFLEPNGDVEDGLPVFLYTQADAQFRGGEFYGTYHNDDLLGGHWDFSASLDLVDAEFSDGSDVPFIPPLSINIGTKAQYGPFGFGVDVNFAAEQVEVSEGFLPTDSYVFVDLKADYELSGLGLPGAKLFIEARNVSDDEGRAAASVLRDTAPLPGRDIRVGARYTF